MPTPKKTTKKATGPIKPGPKSKTKNPVCSAAMSSWKSTGRQTQEVSKILAECRAKAGGKMNYTKSGTGTGKHMHMPVEARIKTKEHRESEIKGISEEVHKKSIEQFGKEGQKFVVIPEGDKSKYVNKNPVGVAARQTADWAEMHVAKILGGKRLKGTEAEDIIYEVKGANGKTHHVEVKSKTTSENQELKVHGHSLHRKALKSRENGIEYHTVLVDMRDIHMGGEFAHLYSKNKYYYMRGLKSSIALSKMHPMKDPEKELHKLINMKEEEIPTESARHSFSRLTSGDMAALSGKGVKSKRSATDRQLKLDESYHKLGMTRHSKGEKIKPAMGEPGYVPFETAYPDKAKKLSELKSKKAR